MTNADLINTVQMYIRELRKHLPKDIKQIFTVACHTEMAKKLTGGVTEGEWYTGAYQSDPAGNPLDLSYPYVVNICSTDHPAMSKTSIFTSVESEGEKETPTNPFAFANSNAQFGEYAKPRVFDEQLEVRQFNNQIGKTMFPITMLAESMSRLKAKAEKLKAIKPFRCAGCNRSVTSFCPGDHSGCPNDFDAIRDAVFGSNAVRPVRREELKVANQEGLNEARCPLPLHVIPNHMGINLCNVKNVEWFIQDDGQLTSLTINFIPAK